MNAEGVKNVILSIVSELGVDVSDKHIGLMGNNIHSNLQMKREASDLLKQEMPFFKDFIYFIFRHRGRERGREGEKHQCVVASHEPPTGDLAPKPRHEP